MYKYYKRAPECITGPFLYINSIAVVRLCTHRLKYSYRSTISIVICRAEFKKRKVIRHFLVLAKNCESLCKLIRKLRIIIHNLFAFLLFIHKMCLKRSENQKKRFFGESI